jgi:hypothetical protein
VSPARGAKRFGRQEQGASRRESDERAADPRPTPSLELDEPGPENFTLGASDVMRQIKRSHEAAIEAEAELTKCIEALGAQHPDHPDITAARMVLADHPAPLGSSVLQIAPYWEVRAERARTAAATLHASTAETKT